MHQRKNNSLFGKRIKDALTNESVWLKSEELPKYRPFYVDFNIINRIHNNSNQLIIGRRGTGKTHLLGTFDEFINEENQNEISVFISIMEAVPRTPPSIELESYDFANRKMARLMFEGFLRRFFNIFLDQADLRLRTFKTRKNKDEFNKISSETNSLLTRLLEAVEIGKPFHTDKTYKHVIIESSNGHKSKGAEIEVAINKLVPNIKASGGIGRKGMKESIIETHLEIDSLISIDLFEVRDLVHKIIKCLEIKTLYILIDEWMELDKRTPSNIQPIFAQMLKTTFFNTKYISVKIATIWHQTTLYDKGNMERSKGIQLKHDIVRAVDLDTAFLTSNEEVIEFCKNLLFKRLSYACKDLEILMDEKGQVDDIFITEIFDNFNNFKAFITASHGLPRDLMDIFQRCSLKINRNFEELCISHSLVFSVSKNIYKTDKRKNIDPNSIAQILLAKINNYMENSGRRLFIVKNENVKNSNALRKLVDEELIHQVPSPVTPRCVYDTHKAYLVDFGNYIDWIETKKKDLASLLSETVFANFPEMFEEEYKTYEINLEEIEDSYITCTNCHHSVHSSDPVYIKYKACPKCAFDLTHKNSINRTENTSVQN